jgi:hypothetical protein
MKPDIPLLNQPEKSNGLVTREWVQREIIRVVEARLRFYKLIQIQELRRSCGVESKGSTLQVNVPQRYRK